MTFYFIRFQRLTENEQFCKLNIEVVLMQSFLELPLISLNNSLYL